VTIRNVPITIGFVAITTSQVAVGLGMTILGSGSGGVLLPPVPLDAYNSCVFSRHRPLEVAYTSISLLFDLLAFSLFILLAKRSKASGLKVRLVLDIIAEDATWYFLVIFSSHLVLVLTLNLARPAIQLLPGPGIVVYLPIMISRIMISLRKAADSPHDVWSLMEPTTNVTNFQSIRFFPQRTATGEDGMPLETFHES